MLIRVYSKNSVTSIKIRVFCGFGAVEFRKIAFNFCPEYADNTKV